MIAIRTISPRPNSPRSVLQMLCRQCLAMICTSTGDFLCLAPPPKIGCHGKRINGLIFPPRDLVAGLVQQPVMQRTQRHGVFVRDFPAHRPRLCEAQMMRLRPVAAADEAGLSSNEPQMRLVSNA